jgi:class 3 adenylate cyclase
MIPLSTNLEQWCRHKTGVEKILNKSGWLITKASAELNKNGEKIISSFGNREFRAMVGFVDMRGFSDLSQGKRPTEVREIVVPFISAVIEVARKHGCFIDKTIGDEVMIVMPWFEEDTVVSDAELPHRKAPIFALATLFRDLIIKLKETVPSVRFSSGFTFGNLVLDRVGGDGYSEWTVYGNCVNAAKRLQSQPLHDGWFGHHVLAVGELETELSHFPNDLDLWVTTQFGNDLVKRISPVAGKKQFKGVGLVNFAQSAIALDSEPG